MVYSAGTLIYTSSSTKIACETTPCTVTLIVPSDSPTGLEELENLETSLTYNEDTNIFTFTYDDTNSFQKAMLKVSRFNSGNSSDNAVVCWNNATTSSGIISCDISGEVNGTYVAKGYIVRSDTGEHLVEVEYGYLGDTIYNKIGPEGVIWSFFIFIGIVMLGVSRPALAILASIFGVIALSMLNIISIGITAIIAIVAIGIIILIQVGKE